MLNRDDNENGFKANRSNKKKKNKLHVQHALSFPFPVVLHDYNAVLYD